MAIDVNKSNILLRRSAEILNYKLIRKFISIGLTACACAMTLVYVAAAHLLYEVEKAEKTT